jgi:hypothetical protein
MGSSQSTQLFSPQKHYSSAFSLPSPQIQPHQVLPNLGKYNQKLISFNNEVCLFDSTPSSDTNKQQQFSTTPSPILTIPPPNSSVNANCNLLLLLLSSTGEKEQDVLFLMIGYSDGTLLSISSNKNTTTSSSSSISNLTKISQSPIKNIFEISSSTTRQIVCFCDDEQIGSELIFCEISLHHHEFQSEDDAGKTMIKILKKIPLSKRYNNLCHVGQGRFLGSLITPDAKTSKNPVNIVAFEINTKTLQEELVHREINFRTSSLTTSTNVDEKKNNSPSSNWLMTFTPKNNKLLLCQSGEYEILVFDFNTIIQRINFRKRVQFLYAMDSENILIAFEKHPDQIFLFRLSQSENELPKVLPIQVLGGVSYLSFTNPCFFVTNEISSGFTKIYRKIDHVATEIKQHIKFPLLKNIGKMEVVKQERNHSDCEDRIFVRFSDQQDPDRVEQFILVIPDEEKEKKLRKLIRKAFEFFDADESNLLERDEAFAAFAHCKSSFLVLSKEKEEEKNSFFKWC